MAARYLIIAIVTLSATQASASGGFTTFASTYNTHAINHAVAYPASISSVALAAAPVGFGAHIPGAVALPPPASIPLANAIPAPAAATAVTATPAAPSKPVTSSTPAVLQSPVSTGTAADPAQIPLVASGQVAFAATPFAFVAPGKFGLPAAPSYAAGISYAPTYGAPPAYAHNFAAVPGYVAAPAHVTGPAFTSVTAHAASGEFAMAPNKVAFNAPAAFAGPSYIPW